MEIRIDSGVAGISGQPVLREREREPAGRTQPAESAVKAEQAAIEQQREKVKSMEAARSARVLTKDDLHEFLLMLGADRMSRQLFVEMRDDRRLERIGTLLGSST
jgi:hypothetical protein